MTAPEVRERFASARVARLATVARDGRPHLVPIVYALGAGRIYHAVDHARSHIYLENPYVSDGPLTAKLRAARARGVDVRAVLTVRGNVPRLNRYVTLTANRLLVRTGPTGYQGKPLRARPPT